MAVLVLRRLLPAFGLQQLPLVLPFVPRWVLPVEKFVRQQLLLVARFVRQQPHPVLAFVLQQPLPNEGDVPR
ncbi:MAG: hypothetical protein A3K40_05835 [Syntrophobacterales bacterium RIFOXYC2_FULL_60_23]|nr:MAG: hypothetical protein A3K40_05835 [Syntrophobacterales bacterium RIFOXYC2_FULL_60_23]